MATKLDAGSVFRCKLPPPSADLFDEMGSEGMIALAEVCGLGLEDLADFAEIPEEYQDSWRAIARAMYARMAMRAGARVEGVKGKE